MTYPEPGREQYGEVVSEPQPSARLRVVRVVNGLISLITGLFAAVLALHILLVVGEANMQNDFAQFVTNWAKAVDLGLDTLFLVGNAKVQVMLNEGIAALLWLVIGGALTTLMARIFVPEGESRVWYRRTMH
ncbi:MAG: hypothetical protein GEU97_21120 [Actinophytocola sp.]|nr:hypothetical protein [Actinophytocola sp.]